MTGNERLDTAIFADLLAIYNEIKAKNDVEWEELLYRNGASTKNEFIEKAKTIREEKKECENALKESMNAFVGGDKSIDDESYTVTFTKNEVSMIDSLMKAYGAKGSDRKDTILGSVSFLLSMKKDDKTIKTVTNK